MIAFGIAILLVTIANLGFSAVLLFHLGRLVAVTEVKDPAVSPLTQPPRLVQIKRPGDTKITEDVGKRGRKLAGDDLVSTSAMSDNDIDKAIKDLENI